MRSRMPIPLLLTLLVACGTTKETLPVDQPDSGPDPSAGSGGEPEGPREILPTPWTNEFMTAAMLLADRVRVEGPVGLLEHIVVRSDDALFNRVVKTTPEGFLQVTRIKQQPDDKAEQLELVRGQLDAWQIVAYEEIVVLERPGDVPVTVVADGDCVWRDTDGEEERGPRLTFRGEVDRTPPGNAAAQGDEE